MPKGFQNLKPQTGTEKARLDDLVDMEQYPNKKWLLVRFLPSDILAVKQHWITIVVGDDRREIRIPKICLSWDAENECEHEDIECPYCSLGGQEDTKPFYLANAIIREVQEDKPRRLAKPTRSEARTGFKEKDSRAWTPVRVLRIPPTLAQQVMDLTELNKVKINGKVVGKEVSDARFGVDVNIKFDKEAKGSGMYTINKEGRTPLTEEEKKYLVWELTADSIIKKLGLETEERAQREIDRMEIVSDDDDMEVDKKSKGSKKKRRPSEDDMDLGSSKKKRRRRRDEDDDLDDDELDDDELDDDEDEDEEPPRKRRSKKKPAGRKRRRVEEDDEDDEDEDFDDEDEDFDDEDEDFDEDEDADEDEEDFDEDEEDEDEEPQRKRRSKKKPAGRKRRRVEEDDEDEEDEDFDDEDEDFDEDEEDEDEEPPRKRRAKSSSSRRSGSRSSGGKRRRQKDDIPF